MPAKAPMIDTGRASIGITVADRLRRNRKITITTSATVRPSVNCTSSTDSRIDCDRSSRSEEHTSELQSLMRISYAVFCLKKKNKKNKINILVQNVTNTNTTHT